LDKSITNENVKRKLSMKFFILIIVAAVSFGIVPAFAQTNIEPVEYGPPDSSTLMILAVIVVIAFISNIILVSSKKLQDLRKKTRKQSEKGELLKSPYDRLDLSELKSLASRLSVNYTILITIYAVLLAFVVSDKASLAFSSWYFVIWCGWVLAIVVRAGIIMNDLFDISDKDPKKETSRQIYASREFFKHSLYLLVPTIAFLPTFFLTPEASLENIQSLPWSIENSIILAAIAITAMFFAFYQFPLRIREFTKRGGTKDAYFVVILLLTLGGLAGYGISPLNPVEVYSAETDEYYEIPSIVHVILIGGIFYAGIMIGIYLKLIPKNIREKISSED